MNLVVGLILRSVAEKQKEMNRSVDEKTHEKKKSGQTINHGFVIV